MAQSPNVKIRAVPTPAEEPSAIPVENEAPVKPADYKPDARMAIERASGLLAKSSEEFFKEGGGCMGCHHQPFAGRAYGAVKAAGLPAEPRLRQILVNGMLAERAKMLQDAFMVTMRDADFLADAKQQKLDVAPEDGEHLATLVKKIYATPKPIVDKIAGLIK